MHFTEISERERHNEKYFLSQWKRKYNVKIKKQKQIVNLDGIYRTRYN